MPGEKTSIGWSFVFRCSDIPDDTHLRDRTTGTLFVRTRRWYAADRCYHVVKLCVQQYAAWVCTHRSAAVRCVCSSSVQNSFKRKGIGSTFCFIVIHSTVSGKPIDCEGKVCIVLGVGVDVLSVDVPACGQGSFDGSI